jgi:putative acetyltransferase
MPVEVRPEQPSDIAAIRDLNRQAFGQDLEADIVDRLRTNGAALLSLVAALDREIVGHIMYSPVVIGDTEGAGLGPMAVSPSHQRQGIGSQLVREGSRRLQEMRIPFVVVVGHPGFYPRFGFEPARRRGITCEWEVPDDVFMFLNLDTTRTRGMSGQATYRREFSNT